jgi:hypothetical protein
VLTSLLASTMVAIVLVTSIAGLRATETFTSVLTFPVTDNRGQFRVEIGRDVVLQVRRAVDAQGRHFGWDFSATDRRLDNSPNFFDDCLCGHGPRPHDLHAWHFDEGYFPAERILPIFGYPFEVRVLCVDCVVAGHGGTEAQFTSGTVEIGSRRLVTANHRQLRISDIDRPRK